METTKKSPARLLIISLAILLAATFILSGLCTDWGNVKITRVELMEYNGQRVSAIIYIPKTATMETPAAAAVLLHGRSNTAHVTHTWATEMARRGYVVIAPDMQGGGESDIIAGNMMSDTAYQDVMWNYLQTCGFVKPDAIFWGGFSAGAAKALVAGNKYADTCPGVISCAAVRAPSEPAQTNLLLLKAQNDQYNASFGYGPRDLYEQKIAADLQLGVDSAVSGVTYGSLEQKNALRYVFMPVIIHQMSDVTPTGISAMLDFMMDIEPAVKPIDSHSTVWQLQQVVSLVCAIAFIGFVCGLGNVLIHIPWFEKDVVNPMPVNRGYRGKKYWISVLEAFAIPALIFIPVSAKGMGGWLEQNPIFRSKNLNGVMAALLTVQLISIIIKLVKYFMKKKKGVSVQLSDYGLAEDGAKKIHWVGVAKSLLIGFIVVITAFVWLYFVEEYGGTNYQCWRMIVINRFNIHRLAATFPYMCCIFIILFVSGSGMNTDRRLDDKNSLLKCMLINALVAASGVLFLLILQYGSSILTGWGNAIFKQQSTGAVGGTSVGALDFAVGFPFIIGSMAAINTYFFKKTGNIWTGTLIGAVLAASMATTQFTFAI